MLQIPTLSPMSRTILIYVGWFFLPNWATGVTVVLYNRIVSYFNPNYTPPIRGSPQSMSQWRYCYAFVMLSYLVTTTVHSCWAMPSNFYEILGVGPDADDQALKLAFRTFARKNHPDRVGPQGAPLFIAVRDAYEALNQPVKRFAYDRCVKLSKQHLCR
jgi:DnaJ domain